MCKLFGFIDINKTAMRKICKKWDKQANDMYLLNWYDLFNKENKRELIEYYEFILP